MSRAPRSRVGFSVLAAFALAAMSAGPAQAQDAKPGTLSIAFESGVQHFDPALAYDVVGIPLVHAMFDTLVSYDKDLNIVPSLASEMPTISADALTYTFKLRPGVQFVKNGAALRELTADDVVYSLNRLLRPDLKPTPSPVGGGFFSVIAGSDAVLAGTAQEASGLKALDDHTVEITLAHPDRTFLNLLAMTFGSVVPKDLAPLDGTFDTAPIGSGAYYLDAYKADEKVSLKKNTSYWREGYPKADAIDGHLLVTAENQVQQVESGQLDMMGQIAIPAADYTSLSQDPTYADLIVKTAAVSTQYLSMDTSGPDSPFKDVRVRQAVNHVIDKANILRLANGLGEEVDCILPRLMPGYDETCHPYPTDLAAAQKLMADAGMSAGFDTKLYTDTTSISQNQAQSIATDLATINIRAEVVPQDFNVLLGTVTTPHAAPMVWVGWFQDYPDPSDFIDPILSCATAVAGAFNNAWFCDPAIDARSAAARKIPILADAIPEYQAIQKAIMDEAPWVPVASPLFVGLHGKRVTGFDGFDPVYTFDLASYGVQP